VRDVILAHGVVVVVAAILSLSTPRSIPHRLRPMAIAAAGFVTSTLFWHA
jgi:hypothetical protein